MKINNFQLTKIRSDGKVEHDGIDGSLQHSHSHEQDGNQRQHDYAGSGGIGPSLVWRNRTTITDSINFQLHKLKNSSQK